MSRRPLALRRLVLLVVLPVIATVGAGYWWLSGGRFVVTENAYVKAHIVQIAPEVAGTVRRVPVLDHATVSTGDTLLTLETIRRLRAEAGEAAMARIGAVVLAAPDIDFEKLRISSANSLC